MHRMSYTKQIYRYSLTHPSNRGISSTVRRCIEKETGKEFAAKIIDLGATTEAGETNPYHMLEATRQEISILRQVMGHPYISEYQQQQRIRLIMLIYLPLIIHS